jgi:hypothetical protein
MYEVLWGEMVGFVSDVLRLWLVKRMVMMQHKNKVRETEGSTSFIASIAYFTKQHYGLKV